MAEYLTQDFAGADKTFANNDVIAGVLSGIGKCTIPAGATVFVKRYDGSNHGSVEIQALEILIESTGILDASGSGFGGGGGGNGNPPGYGPTGIGYGGGGDSHYAGDPFLVNIGGEGGIGGGAYGGNVAGYGSLPSIPAGWYQPGYDAANEGVPTSALDALKGSAGGGGSGGYPAHDGPNQFAGGGGGAGRTGGGAVLLKSPRIRILGTILSNEKTAGDGMNSGGVNEMDHGVGGNAVDSGSSAGGPSDTGRIAGSAGGKGAGGGLLLQFNGKMAQITALPKILVTGTINNQGGLADANGGTIKVSAPIKTVSGTITTRTSGIKYITSASFGAMASA